MESLNSPRVGRIDTLSVGETTEQNEEVVLQFKFHVPYEIEYLIGTFMEPNMNTALISKNFYKAYKDSVVYKAIKIQKAWRKNRVMSAYEFEINDFGDNVVDLRDILKRFYWVHYPYPEYVILSALFFGIVTDLRDNIRKRFYYVLKELTIEELLFIGY